MIGRVEGKLKIHWIMAVRCCARRRNPWEKVKEKDGGLCEDCEKLQMLKLGHKTVGLKITPGWCRLNDVFMGVFEIARCPIRFRWLRNLRTSSEMEALLCHSTCFVDMFFRSYTRHSAFLLSTEQIQPLYCCHYFLWLKIKQHI